MRKKNRLPSDLPAEIVDLSKDDLIARKIVNWWIGGISESKESLYEWAIVSLIEANQRLTQEVENMHRNKQFTEIHYSGNSKISVSRKDMEFLLENTDKDDNRGSWK